MLAGAPRTKALANIDRPKRIILHYVDCSKTEMRVGEVMVYG